MAWDETPDPEQGKAAEAEVSKYRETNTLPFPKMRQTKIEDLEGTLDHPLKGANRLLHGKEDFSEAAKPLSDRSTEPKK